VPAPKPAGVCVILAMPLPDVMPRRPYLAFDTEPAFVGVL
jgi:hypothetical protein